MLFCFTVCGAGSAPVGTDIAAGEPDVTARGLGTDGINRDHRIGAGPGFPERCSAGRR